MTSLARERLMAFRRSQPRAPRLARRTVAARGLEFAVFTSPEVSGVPPLLCINGGMLYSHALLWPALAPFAAGRQVILYDQRGRGASDEPPAVGDSRIEYDTGDVLAIREALGIARWDLLGHSWGGGIAMLAASRDLIGVRRLVTIDSVGATSEWIPSLHENALARLSGVEREALAAIDPRMLHAADPALHAEYSRAIYPAYFADHEFTALFRPPHETSATGAAVAARLRRDGYDWRSRARGIASQTLVVHGSADVIPSRVAHDIASLVPHATLEIIDDAGHMPFFERPEFFFPLVRRFLDHPDAGS
ncbi:MAG: alpha/beta fold hydrolase [Gemmatimonadales bacterium]